jgi:hypothetical protein
MACYERNKQCYIVDFINSCSRDKINAKIAFEKSKVFDLHNLTIYSDKTQNTQSCHGEKIPFVLRLVLSQKNRFSRRFLE